MATLGQALLESVATRRSRQMTPPLTSQRSLLEKSPRRAPDGGFETGQDMAKPTKPNEPEQAANQEKRDSGKKSTLGQLAEPRNKKTADSCKNITSRTLTHTSTKHRSSA
jgi:hypothetical protein